MICSPILLNEDHGTLRGRALCWAIHRHDTDNRRTAARVDARPPIDGRATDGFTARADDSAEAKQGREVIFLLHDGNGISLFRLKCQHEIKMPQSHQAPSQGVHIHFRLSCGRVCVRRLFVLRSVATCVAFVLCWFVWRSCAAAHRGTPKAADCGRRIVHNRTWERALRDRRRTWDGLLTDG